MLYLHLLTLGKHIDFFIIGHSNISFTNRENSPATYTPFEEEISKFHKKIVFVYVDFNVIPLAQSKYRNGTAWSREATMRNHLIEGVKRCDPAPDDLVILCDVDEIITRAAIALILARPPIHYYNLRGTLFHYSFRWQVGEWVRPMVIRYGSLIAPLDDYKFMPFLTALPGILHYHCSFCFPHMADIFTKLKSFSHTEYSEGKFQDPNYVYARIACGYGVLPARWNMPERLKLVDFDSKAIFLPKDRRFDFLKSRIGFRDLADFKITHSGVNNYLPPNCTLKLGLSSVGVLM
jgi:hypothetical protein